MSTLTLARIMATQSQLEDISTIPAKLRLRLHQFIIILNQIFSYLMHMNKAGWNLMNIHIILSKFLIRAPSRDPFIQPVFRHINFN